ncbi:diguanylate cyclase [Candidatus Bipolaricaulota bacterium]|nr:diguanylate cyclase [Candidatus Bipolaricaulota bacterium]
MKPERQKFRTTSLQQAELKYSTVFENTGTATIIIESDNTISAANKEFEDLSGYKKSEIEGQKSWTEFFSEEKLPMMKDYHSRRREEGEEAPNRYETRFVDRYDNVKEVLLNMDMIPGTEKSVASISDISKQKKTERRLKAVDRISRELVLAEDKDELYRLILDGIEGVFGFDNTSILEGKEEKLQIVVGRKSQAEARGRVLSLDQPSIAVMAFKQNRPIYVPDVEEDRRYIPATPDSETRSEFAVPISLEGKAYGVLNIEDDKLDAFTVQDREMITILTSEVDVALRGLERMNRLEESRSKLRGLHRAVDRTQICKTEEELFETAVETAHDILEFELCSIDRIEGDRLVPRAASSEIDPDDTKTGQVGEGIGGVTAEREETIWGDDVQRRDDARPTNEDFHSFISVPIGDMAVMQVVSTKVGAFNEEDVELVEILADHLLGELKRVGLEEELKEQAIRDPLTGLYNRRFLKKILQKEEERVKRYGGAVALLMVDLDDFKRINDNYSHLVGDKVLRGVSGVLSDTVRGADTIVRYGGDEFLIFIPEFENNMESIIERIEKEVKRWNKRSDLIDEELDLTVGTAVWDSPEDRNIEDALKRADNRMYERKEE